MGSTNQTIQYCHQLSAERDVQKFVTKFGKTYESQAPAINRLELSGASKGVDFALQIQNAIPLLKGPPVYFTDSMVPKVTEHAPKSTISV